MVLLLLLAGAERNAFAWSAASRKQEAASQFAKAEQMREALNGRPEEERTRRDYQRVADAYRKVYYVAPASSKADARDSEQCTAVSKVFANQRRSCSVSFGRLSSPIKRRAVQPFFERVLHRP